MQTGRLFTLRGRLAASKSEIPSLHELSNLECRATGRLFTLRRRLQARAKFPRFINLSKALVCYLIVCSYGTVPHQICALLKLDYKSTIAQSIEICLLLRVFSPTRGAVLNAPPSQYCDTVIGSILIMVNYRRWALPGPCRSLGPFRSGPENRVLR